MEYKIDWFIISAMITLLVSMWMIVIYDNTKYGLFPLVWTAVVLSNKMVSEVKDGS